MSEILIVAVILWGAAWILGTYIKDGLKYIGDNQKGLSNYNVENGQFYASEEMLQKLLDKKKQKESEVRK